ncbi:CcdB family protein [Polaromonas sp.]|uniref:CcdB family protein n=1 Tax=Polaromonas sp. TaxID=1869339 RepID=UPI0035643451
MAQYDVYENPNAAQRPAFPFVVVLQSDQLDYQSTRFVMPLARLPHPPANAPRRLAQTVEVDGERLFLGAHLCAAIPSRLLRLPVMDLRRDAAALSDALDAVVSGV